MNRTAQLAQTLPVNIIDNINHPNIEFIILDYNSKDGMEDWVKAHLSEYINTGLVKYYKTYDPEYFSASHSKNMAVKLASGNINCLLDADNYAGPGYAQWVDSVFGNGEGKIIITTLRKEFIIYRDQGGKICFRKDDFNAINGFDEAFKSYGLEDVDVVRRMEKDGGTRVFIDDERYLRYIGHSHEERLANYPLMNKIDSLYLQDPTSNKKSNKALYLFKDNSFMEVHYEFNAQLEKDILWSFGGWKIKSDGQKNGHFERIKNTLLLKFEKEPPVVYQQTNTGIVSYDTGDRVSWDKVPEKEELYFTLVMGYGECVNRIKYKENDGENPSVNAGGWGRGTVYFNFDTLQAINI